MKPQSSLPSPSRTATAVVTALCTCLLVIVMAHPAFAQEVSATAGTPLVMEKTLFQRLMAAGPVFMGTLFMASVFMVWLVIDGLMRTAKAKLAPPSAIAGLRQNLIDGDYETATQTVTAQDSVFAEVATAAFTKVGLGKDATDDAIFEEMERSRAVFNSRISYLSVIGVITPMIGLTGTVFGMIHAFDTLGSSGVGDPTK
ncbi:MAG: MotA/TolQ/ExbB proton channel family protein, partial [Opitutaceae bacterium]